MPNNTIAKTRRLASPGSPTRILLIEDDPSHALLIEELLAEARDMQVLLKHVDHLAAGLEHLAGGGVDAVLLDLHLPDSDGLAGLQAVLAHAPGVPTLVLTALDDGDLALAAMQAGAQDYLIKGELDERLLARAVHYAIERERAEQVLRASEERFKAFMNNSPAWSWMKDAEGRFVYANKAFESALGLQPEELLGRTDFDIWPAETAERIHEDDRQVLATGETAEIAEIVYARESLPTHLLTFKFPIRDSAGRDFVGSVAIDVTARTQAEEQLQHQAFHDHLTNLPNRALFMDRLQHALVRADRRHGRTAVLFLDLDNFKLINDSLGHRMGDELLVAVSRRLRACVRPGDTVARLGGDEFTVLLEDLNDVEDATKVAERIAEELRGPITLGGRNIYASGASEWHEVFATTSIGIAVQMDPREHPEDLLRNADMAMYEAKRRGKARYALFEAEMKSRATRHLQLETDLRYAIDRGELRLYYQPIVDLVSGRVNGMEALVRWQHPQHGLMLPGEFIPIAEQSELILLIGKWVLEQACRQVREWQRLHPAPGGVPPLVVSVNLSARQFGHPQLLEEIIQVLRDGPLDPRYLCAEITESIGIEDATSTTATLRQLKALGIRLALDDFGTGYSALSYLQRYPIDTLKLDRSFVARLGQDRESSAIVQAVISFAKALNLTLTAEGIETEEQLQQLRALGCDQGQGYYFAHPMTAAEMSRLLDPAAAEQVKPAQIITELFPDAPHAGYF